MKIAIGKISQESNSFNPMRTGMKEFENSGYAKGKNVLKNFGRTSEIGGFVSGTGEWKEKVELFPLIRAHAPPQGPLRKGALARIEADLKERLQLSSFLDGVLLSLHGSLLAEGEADVDGRILKIVKGIIGPKTPLVATLDLHANVTERMVENADMLVAFHTAPHLDIFETGKRAASLLYRMISKNVFPKACWTKIPMIIPSEKHNVFSSPMKDLFDLVHKAEEDESVWSVSLCVAQPWLDVPEHGWSVICWGENEKRLREYTEKIALKSWKMRKMFNVRREPPKQAVQKSLSFKGKPVIIADGADATNSGAPGDSTILLKEFLRESPQEKILLTLVDPEVVRKSIKVGVGEKLKTLIGGKRDNLFSDPVEIEAEVQTIFSGKYTLSGHGGKNLPVNTGKTVVLKCGEIYIVVSEFPPPGGHPIVYRSAGLEPKEAKVVVVKSPAGFRADYKSFAAKIILADTAGLASPHYTHIPYKTDRNSFYPWHDNFEWRPRIKMKD